MQNVHAEIWVFSSAACVRPVLLMTTHVRLRVNIYYTCELVRPEYSCHAGAVKNRFDFQLNPHIRTRNEMRFRMDMPKRANCSSITTRPHTRCEIA